MKKLFEKHLILKYIIVSYVKILILSLLIVSIVSIALVLTGVYSQIERALDLKYNSPYIMSPLYGFIALAGLCFFIGFLMYFYKYKRSKIRSAFYQALSSSLNEKSRKTKT
jgi:hypothetical protein